MEIAQNQKWHLFLEKGVFLTWVKKWFLLTVFLESCAFLKTLFLQCFQENTSFLVKKDVCWKKTRIYEK